MDIIEVIFQGIKTKLKADSAITSLVTSGGRDRIWANAAPPTLAEIS